MNTQDLSAYATVAIAVLTLIWVVVAWVQLAGIKRGMNLSSLMAVLEIETQMNERKMHFDQCSADVRLADVENAPSEVKKIRAALFNSAKENYLNAMDRLCFCILKEYLRDKDWRAEYRNVLKQTVEKFATTDFTEASPFRNIKKLNSKWQDE